jgi:hypothetical protein
MEDVAQLLPAGSKTMRMVRMVIPHVLADLEDVPEEVMQTAVRFVLIALARVYDPRAPILVIDVERQEVRRRSVILGDEQLPELGGSSDLEPAAVAGAEQ